MKNAKIKMNINILSNLPVEVIPSLYALPGMLSSTVPIFTFNKLRKY